LLASVGITVELRVTKESLFYFDGELPMVVIMWDDVPWYAVPAFDPKNGNPKMGYHGARHVVDPDVDSREPDAGLGRRLSEIVRDGIGVLQPEPVRAETCLYTNTADDGFVLDVRGPLVIASPCSGHGFKFAPLIGEALACLATGRTPPVDLAAFRIDR
jgi:sarcosine oxidase